MDNSTRARAAARFLSGPLLAGLLAACATAPAPRADQPTAAEAGEAVPDLQAIYGRLAQVGGKVYPLDAKSSAVRIYVFRAGSAAKLGHNHVLSAPRFRGYLHVPPNGTADARFDLEFRLDQLELDDPAQRAVLGGAFASTVSPDAIAVTRDHMLGAENVQADRFPFVRIHSLRVAGEPPKIAARIAVELHGRTQEIAVPLNVSGLPQHVEVSGSLVLRQSDFGVKPYSVLNGVLAVQDELVIEFRLADAPPP